MRTTYIAAVVGATLFIAGCGDDDDDEKSSAAAATKPGYIAKADPICIDAKTKSRVQTKKLEALPADAEVRDTVPALEEALRVNRDAVQKLRALDQPTEDRATLDSYLSSLDEAIVAGDELLVAAKTNDLEEVNRVGGGNEAAKAERKRIAKRYGFKHCA